jgi:hypothetical protein
LTVNLASRDPRVFRVRLDFRAHREKEDLVVNPVKMAPLVLWDHKVQLGNVDEMGSLELLDQQDPRAEWAKSVQLGNEECLDFRACKDCQAPRESQESLVR